MIRHEADNESTPTALLQPLYCKSLYWQPELPHSLWKLKASVQISVQTANGWNHLESVTQGLRLTCMLESVEKQYGPGQEYDIGAVYLLEYARVVVAGEQA